MADTENYYCPKCQCWYKKGENHVCWPDEKD